MNEDQIKEMLSQWMELKKNMDYLEQEINKAVIEHKATVKVGNAVAEYVPPIEKMSEVINPIVSFYEPSCIIYLKNT